MGRSMQYVCRIFAVTAATLIASAALTPAATQESREAGFLVENHAAMGKMMAAMEVKPSGDIDRDFAAIMIPHHQGAVDMALAELRFGRNERLRRIAQEIVVEQQQEMVAMRQVLDHELGQSVHTPSP